MDATVTHKMLSGKYIRLCCRCNMAVTGDGKPDPEFYSAEWIEKFNVRPGSKCEHKEKSPEPKSTTVDELLAKLDAEHEKITGELPNLYQTLGFKFFCNYERPQAWPITEAHSIIVRKMDRQQEILDLKKTIRSESERTA